MGRSTVEFRGRRIEYEDATMEVWLRLVVAELEQTESPTWLIEVARAWDEIATMGAGFGVIPDLDGYLTTAERRDVIVRACEVARVTLDRMGDPLEAEALNRLEAGPRDAWFTRATSAAPLVELAHAFVALLRAASFEVRPLEAAHRAELEDHRRWSESGDGASLVWSMEDLPSRDLRDAWLAGAVIVASNLERCDLDGSNLTDANAASTRFVGASLRRARCRKVGLQQADLTRADLTEADLTRADLSRAILCDAILQRACLERAHVHETNLLGAELQGADLTAASVVRADLSGANLDGTRFLQTRITSSTRWDRCRALATANVESIVVAGVVLAGEVARAWLRARVEPPPWGERDLRAWVQRSVVAGRADAEFAVPSSAVDFERVLGAPAFAEACAEGGRELRFAIDALGGLVVVEDDEGSTRLVVLATRDGALTLFEANA